MWFQGCSLGCRGCLARDTWPVDGGSDLAVDDVAERLAAVIAADGLEGVTISGGEPFEQPEALSGLLTAVRRLTAGGGREVDLLCYSGLSERRLRRQFPAVLEQLDALIPEPFTEALESGHAWWGSGNQRLVALSPLGRARYATVPTAERAVMQVSVEDGTVWLVGVPRRGDLEAATRRAAQAGVHMGRVSWRP